MGRHHAPGRPARAAASGRPARGRTAERAGDRGVARGAALSRAAPGSLAYLDSSAYVKLVLQEPGAAALAGALVEWAGRVSSALLAVEAVRAAARYGDRFAQAARDGLQDVSLMPVDLSLLEAAAVLAAPSLRSLDAVHLATALRLGRELGPVFCYDERLAAAARGAGLDVRAPA